MFMFCSIGDSNDDMDGDPPPEVCPLHVLHCMYDVLCSMQSGNLCNLQIVLYIYPTSKLYFTHNNPLTEN